MRLVQLMFRASVMRVTAVVIAIASALLMLAASTVTSLSLTPEQLADRELGSADMSIQLPTTLASGAGLSPNRAFEAIVQEAGGTGLRYSLSVPAIPVAGEGNLYQFIETAWELRPFPHRYNLVDGRWPSRPGEVVLVERHQGRVGRLELFGGVTSVAVVGRATDLFAEANHEILASPGTWASFHSEVSQRFPTTVANVTVYWNGSRPPALSALARPWLASISEDERDSVLSQMGLSYATRQQYIAASTDPLLGAFPIALLLPLIAVPFAVTMATGSLIGRWLARLANPLVQLGVPRRLVTRATRVAAAAWALMALFGGASAGVAAGLAIRPILDEITSQPLSPISLPWSALMLSSLGLVLGLVLVPAVSLRADRVALAGLFQLPLTRRRRGLAVVASVVAASQLLFPLSAISVSIVGFTITGVAALMVPDGWALIGRLPTPRTMAGRLGRALSLAESSRSAAAAAALLLALALPTVALSIALSAEEVARRQALDTLPSGYAQLVPAGGAESLPADLREKFERLTGLTSPVEAVLVEVGRRAPDFPGGIWEMSSALDIEKLIDGRLTAAQATTLQSNGILITESSASQVTLEVVKGGSDVALSATRLDIPPELRQWIGGVSLAKTIPPQFRRSVTEYTYTGLTADEAVKVQGAAERLNVSSDYIKYSHATASAAFPLRFTIALWIVGLVPVVVLTTWAAGQSRQLRPYLAGLRALGLPRRWLVRVVARQLGAVIGMATGGALVSLLIATVAIGAAMGVTVVPWQGVAVVAGCTLLASGLGLLTAVTRLSPRERTSV